jgi:hypothetical protein
MTDNNHPITPPPELVQQWYREADNQLGPYYDYIATQAARWGSDQELEACCKLLELSDSNAREFLTAARRPKPPSLKEQALEVVTGLEKRWDLQCDLTLLRRALEALDD